jgi:dihydrofolate reductase
MSRLLRYQVAVSLDGFIAGSTGDYDWIVMDPAIDFDALYDEFDTIVMGRKTYEVTSALGGGSRPGIETIVFSRTLPPSRGRGLQVTNEDPAEVVAGLKARSGRDIWLFGGGELFRALLDAGHVDAVEVALMPVMLGEGVPLLPPGGSAGLKLVDHRVLPNSGIVVLSYSVTGATGQARPIRFIKS